MNRIRVAVVENHDFTREGILKALWKVPEIELVGMATNATQGLQMLLIQKPDVAIVSIDLPARAGIELTRQLKTTQRIQAPIQTKVLILTLPNDRQTVVAALAAGADSYCLKNVSFDNMLEALRATARGNAWIDPDIATLLRGQSDYERN